MPASSAARTHSEATSFSTCEPWVSQLPNVISETLNPLFPRYLNSMGFTLTQMVAQGKGCLPFDAPPLGPVSRAASATALLMVAGPDRDTSDPVSSGASGWGTCGFLKDRGISREGLLLSSADSTRGAT